jgi:tetratricopeptide (TPR) repeat protein
MASLITLKGIDQAIANLNYQNKKSLKYRLVTVLRQFYEDESSVESLPGIDTDELIRLLWGTVDDPATAKEKRKNLRRIRYSVNVDLRTLYRKEKNPEGIIIGPTNTFTMSDEAKDRALRALMADKISAERPSAPGAEFDYGFFGETGPGEELMNEEDILHAIDELDEGYPIGGLEKTEAGIDLGERTLDEDLGEIERSEEEQATSSPPEATGKQESEAEQARAFAETMEDDEDLGEVAFDPEETQYLTVPEDEAISANLAEGHAPEGIAGSEHTMDDERAPIERPDLMSTADSEEKALQEKTQGVDASMEPSGKWAKKKGSVHVQRLLKKGKRATKQMEDALTKRPDDIDLLQQLARAKENSGDLREALSLYQKIIDLSPGEESAEEACLRLSLKLLEKKE